MSLLLAHPLSLLIHRQAVNSVNEPGGSSCSVPNFSFFVAKYARIHLEKHSEPLECKMTAFNFINFT